MDPIITAFQNLAQLFASHHYKLYLVGGTVRDYLLGLPLTDLDTASEATPEEILSFLKADATFQRFGYLRYVTKDGIKFDITTLREEGAYLDNRHPSRVTFIKDIAKDYVRRDFTINALYMDADLTIYDFCHGQEDLINRHLKVIGNPNLRIKEDPLRILRAIRFSLMYDLKIDESLKRAMLANRSLLNKLTNDKIKSELAKIDYQAIDQTKKNQLFAQFAIASLVGVIK